MNAPDFGAEPRTATLEQFEPQRSSVKLVRNAKGDCQIEVKVYVDESEAEIDKAKATATRVYRELESEFYGAFAAKARTGS